MLLEARVTTSDRSDVPPISPAFREALIGRISARRDQIAVLWYKAIAPASFMPFGPAATCLQLGALVEHAARILASEPFEHSQGLAVGVSMARLHLIEPETLCLTHTTLARELMDGLDDKLIATFQPRLAALLGGISAGVLEQVRAMTLEGQEQIQRAFLAARREAVQGRRESEERFRQLAEHIHEVFWLFDCAQNRMVYVSPAFESVWGQTIEIAYADRSTFLTTIHPDDRPRVRQAIENLESSEFDEVYRIVRPSGEQRWVRDHAYPVRDESGRVYRIAGIAEDITAQRLVEEALREGTERERRWAEATFEALVMHDGGVIVDANENFAHMFGCELSDAIGRSVLDFTAPEFRKIVIERIRAGADGPIEAEGLRVDGSRFPGELRARTAPYGGRQVRVAAIRDLTARKRAEEERIALEHKLLEGQRLESLGVLATGVAHDFNNLLSIILGNASLTLLKLSPESPVRSSVEAIAAAARYGSELPRQMLAYAGQAGAELCSVDLDGLVSDTRELLAASIGKQITLDFRLDGHLPTLDADPAQLRQVLMNLIINAGEAIGERDGAITLTTSMRQLGRPSSPPLRGERDLTPGRYVCLTVADTGAGMDSATRDRIFDPFFSTKFIGRGLGLATVAGIVRSHNGRVSVESTLGQGSTFTVLLPASGGAAAGSSQEAPSTTPPTRVLLVDEQDVDF